MSEIKFLTQKDFAQEANVMHGFFTCRGGVSSAPYASLNTGFGSGDAAENVAENRAQIARVIGTKPDMILTVYQEHGQACHVVRAPHDVRNPPRADAMVTDVPGLAIGVLTADCAPVLFHAPNKKDTRRPIIGAAHAGWRGAIAGVLYQTIEAMIGLGADKEKIEVCIGPCIAQASYEVSGSFIEPFLKEHDENDKFFSAGKHDGYYQFDLAGYCAAKMARTGIKTIRIMDYDTYTLKEDFFSYRRATHNKEADYGRQISLIMIQP